MYFTRDLNYGNAKYKMFREIAQEYRTCPEKDFISVDSETPDNFDLDCSTSLKGILCEVNTKKKGKYVNNKSTNSIIPRSVYFSFSHKNSKYVSLALFSLFQK